ncbi:MAG: hypothetical protein ACREON_06785, partial [Gemmatimonadaceae bacterium]
TAVALPEPLPRDVGFGLVLLVPGSGPASALAVFPGFRELTDTTSFDARGLTGTTLELFSRSGLVGRARLASSPGESPTGDCPVWPTAPLTPVDTTAMPAGWSVAFIAGRAQPIPLQPIEALPGTDSARVAAQVTRLASALPNDTATAFRGIPFFVRIAYRFTPAPGVDALVAEVVRKVNVEANPLEEHILIVAERDGTDSDAPYRVGYSNRTSGPETNVVSTEVLAAVTLRATGRPTLVLDSVAFEGDVYSLLERTGAVRWAVRWRSAYSGC